MSAGDIAHVLRSLDEGADQMAERHAELIHAQSGDVARHESKCTDASLSDVGPQITLITKHSPNGYMSKRIYLDEHGALPSDGSQCLMVQGTAVRVSATTANDFAKIIAGCSPDTAIALGSLKQGLPTSVPVTVPAKLKDQPGAITRSREFIDYHPAAPAWCLIDFDAKGMPAAPDCSAVIPARARPRNSSGSTQAGHYGQEGIPRAAGTGDTIGNVPERRWQAIRACTTTC